MIKNHMQFSNKKGNVLLFVIVGMTAIAVLGTGIYFVTTTSTFSGLSANDQNRAYQLAVAGQDYALAKNLGNTGGMDFTLTNGDKFRLLISGDNITSTGIVREGTPYEAKRTIAVTKTGFGSQAGVSDMGAMSVIKPMAAPGDFISKTASTLSLGKIGSSYGSLFGAVIYSGSAVQGNCVDGKCEFGTGFNAFFVFQFASGSTGDGFTFTFFNGNNNNSASVGGYAGSGELMGYAGDSYVNPGYFLDGQGRGIQPPKVAVEFDPYENSGIGCTSGRNDGSFNHMSLVFWGDNTTSCSSTDGRYTFDDNIHGRGTGGAEDPQNGLRVSAGGDACGYFNGSTLCGGGALSWPSNWLLNTGLPNIYAFRVEVRRKVEPETSGNYQYQVKAWIKRCGSGDTTCLSTYPDGSDYTNPKKDYDVIGDNPYLDRIIEISPAYHDRFDTMLFGWTTATGGATQEVNINRFRMNFLQ